MPKRKRIAKITPPRRNDAVFDIWSVIHFVTGVGLGWLMDPFLAVTIMILWEPLEILVLSPILAKKNIIFGYESLRNSLSDIIFDIAGVATGAWLLTEVVKSPFHLF